MIAWKEDIFEPYVPNKPIPEELHDFGGILKDWRFPPSTRVTGGWEWGKYVNIEFLDPQGQGILWVHVWDK